MSEQICLWVQRMACYFIFQSAFLQFLPKGSYRKYIQFYMGLLFLWLLIMTGSDFLGAKGTWLKTPDFEAEEQSQKEWEQWAKEVENRYWQEREEEVDKP